MNLKREHTPFEESRPAEAPPVPKRRFRIEKLEERIAPKKGGGGNGNSSICKSCSGTSGWPSVVSVF